jgi:hypothetical protein
MTAGLAAACRLLAGDDEDKLPEDVKKQPHLIIPSWLTGDESRVYYLTNIGIASGMLDSLGIQVGAQDVLDVMTGKKTLEDIANEMTAPNIGRIIFSINPLLMQGVELASGKSGYYFDPENPSQIRDRLQYIFKQAGFGPIYDIVAGKPSNLATTWGTALANNVATGDAAMWAVYDMEDEYKKENDLGSRPNISYDRDSKEYKKSLAAFYYKLGIKLNDTNAIAKYMAEYVALGGDAKSMDKSLQTLMPLQFMNKEERVKMIAQMTAEEKETYDRAMEYYNMIRAVDDKTFK